MADKPSIVSNLGLKTVAKGVKVTYRLVDYEEEIGRPQDSWRWMITYHHRDDDGKEPETWTKLRDDAGRSAQSLVFTRKWDKVGRHMVQCVAKSRSTGEYVGYAEFDQQVEEMEAILERQMEEARKEKAPNPRTELKVLKKWYLLLKRLGEEQAKDMNKAAREEHEKRLAELESYGKRLSALLKKCGRTIIPFRAVYLAKESMQDVDLRVFFTSTRGGGKSRPMIVDWTNLDEPRLHGRYQGKYGEHESTAVQEGFKSAARAWEDDNRYWPGGIQYEIKKLVSASGTIKTDGKDFQEELTDFLKKIAMGAAILSLVLIPISSVFAGAMIVTSMVAGATGSVLSIHHRHAHGEGDFLDDAIDVLDIVGNVLGVGYRAGKAAVKAVAWQAGKTLKLKVADKVVEAMFIGEVWADGFNGVLLGAKFVGRYNEIMEAKHLMPEERATAMLELFKDAAAATALHGLNNKVATKIEKGDWKKLLSRSDKPEHIDEPSFKGTTAEGKKQVTVVNKQKRHPAAGVETRKAKGKQQKGLKAAKIKQLGMGLKNRKKNLDYVRWSKEKGFQTVSGLSGRGSFGEKVEEAMTVADEIHFNLDGVRFTGVIKKDPKTGKLEVKEDAGKLNEFGEPVNGYTNYELHLLVTKKEYADKVSWWKNGKSSKDWPEGLIDPR